MLSKSKGQILRTAAVLHVLFKLQKEEDDDIKEISSDAMAAAINFIQTSIQHTAYIAGKDTIVNEVEKAETGMYTYVTYSELLSPGGYFSKFHGLKTQQYLFWAGL